MCKELISPVSCFALETVPVRKFLFADSLHSVPQSVSITEREAEKSSAVLHLNKTENPREHHSQESQNY